LDEGCAFSVFSGCFAAATVFWASIFALELQAANVRGEEAVATTCTTVGPVWAPNVILTNETSLCSSSETALLVETGENQSSSLLLQDDVGNGAAEDFEYLCVPGTKFDCESFMIGDTHHVRIGRVRDLNWFSFVAMLVFFCGSGLCCIIFLQKSKQFQRSPRAVQCTAIAWLLLLFVSILSLCLGWFGAIIFGGIAGDSVARSQKWESMFEGSAVPCIAVVENSVVTLRETVSANQSAWFFRVLEPSGDSGDGTVRQEKCLIDGSDNSFFRAVDTDTYEAFLHRQDQRHSLFTGLAITSSCAFLIPAALLLGVSCPSLIRPHPASDPVESVDGVVALVSLDASSSSENTSGVTAESVSFG
jgi:hypothetical protein